MYMGLMMLGRQMHAAEPLVPELSAIEGELAIVELKSHKSPGIDQIPAELIKAGGGTILYEIYKLIISISNKEELPEEWKESIIQIVVIIGACLTYLLTYLLTPWSRVLLEKLTSQLCS
jgi:hypothetical protein